METGTMPGGEASPHDLVTPQVPAAGAAAPPLRCDSPIGSVCHPPARSFCSKVTLTGKPDPRHVGLSEVWEPMGHTFHQNDAVDQQVTDILPRRTWLFLWALAVSPVD